MCMNNNHNDNITIYGTYIVIIINNYNKKNKKNNNLNYSNITIHESGLESGACF